MEFHTETQVCKVDAKLGLVFGFAVISKVNGEPYFDKQGDHIPEDAMIEAATDFMSKSRAAREMHRGPDAGQVLYAFPLTEDIAKALGIETPKTGLLIGMKPNPEHLSKFEDGTYTGFSIGGDYLENESA